MTQVRRSSIKTLMCNEIILVCLILGVIDPVGKAGLAAPGEYTKHTYIYKAVGECQIKATSTACRAMRCGR